VKWHPRLMSFEEKKPADKTSVEHEQMWEDAQTLRNELNEVRGGNAGLRSSACADSGGRLRTSQGDGAMPPEASNGVGASA